MQTNKSIQKEQTQNHTTIRQNQKQNLRIGLNYVQSKRSKENDKTLIINNLKQLNFNFNVKQKLLFNYYRESIIQTSTKQNRKQS